MKQFLLFATLAAGCLVAVGCAPGAGNGLTPLVTLAAASTTPPAVGTESRVASEPLPSVTMTKTVAPAGPTAASELVAVLELATQEMRAAENAVTLAEARRHAEAMVNLLVGRFGRWYGDQDGDGTLSDPSKGRGVLPGEIVTQGADLDNGVKFPAGLALMAAGTDRNPPALRRLLVYTDLWRTNPRAGYDAIELAIESATKSPQLDTLEGYVPRAVAFGRLLLTNAKTTEDAHAFAKNAVSELDAAVREAGTLAQ